jgi:hypothetical protein
MGYLLLKAALSGIIIATVSEVPRRAPGTRRVDRIAALNFGPRYDLAVA